jgi:hypothetical protein
MTQQTINIGNQPGDGTGDPARTAFTKVNQNFTELYTTATNQTPAGSVGQIQYKLSGTSFGGFTASGDASINTTTGVVTVSAPASRITNTPSGTIAATNVQNAINEIVSDLAASSGSSLVGFLQSGTGATARTGQAKLRDFVSVKDFGATGDGTTDDTTAIQAALNALGTYSYTSATTISSPTATGRGKLLFPEGTYIVSAALLFPADCEIYGVGYSTLIKFTATSGVNLFEKNPSKTTKYSSSNATSENVRFSDLLLAGVGYGTAIYCDNVEKLRLDNVVIYNFSTGLYISTTGTGEGYYQYVTNCNFYDNVINTQVSSAAATFSGCYFWHSNSYALATYNIVNEGAQVSFMGCSIEGRPSVAQIYNKSRGLTVIGGYSETRNLAVVGQKPLIKQLVSSDNFVGAPAFTVYGISSARYLFENFDVTASDSSGTATETRFPLIGNKNAGAFLPAITNGNMRYGIYGWNRNGTENAGTVTIDTAKFFNSYSAVKLTHDGSGSNLSLNILPTQTVTQQYVGRRLWITALVYVEAAITSATLVLFGGGNTQTKFSSGSIVDFGNGWKLIAVDSPVVSTAAFTCYFRVASSTVSAAAWITNIQAWVDGYDLIPSSRDISPVYDTAAPSTGTWARGDVVLNSTPSASGVPGWVCVTAGTSGTFKNMAVLSA